MHFDENYIILQMIIVIHQENNVTIKLYLGFSRSIKLVGIVYYFSYTLRMSPIIVDFELGICRSIVFILDSSDNLFYYSPIIQQFNENNQQKHFAPFFIQ